MGTFEPRVAERVLVNNGYWWTQSSGIKHFLLHHITAHTCLEFFFHFIHFIHLFHYFSFISDKRGDAIRAGHDSVQQPVSDPDWRQVEWAAGPGGEAIPGRDGGPGLQQDAAPGPGPGEEAPHWHHGPHQAPRHHPLQLQTDAPGQVWADADDAD